MLSKALIRLRIRLLILWTLPKTSSKRTRRRLPTSLIRPPEISRTLLKTTRIRLLTSSKELERSFLKRLTRLRIPPPADGIKPRILLPAWLPMLVPPYLLLDPLLVRLRTRLSMPSTL